MGVWVPSIAKLISVFYHKSNILVPMHNTITVYHNLDIITSIMLDVECLWFWPLSVRIIDGNVAIWYAVWKYLDFAHYFHNKMFFSWWQCMHVWYLCSWSRPDPIIYDGNIKSEIKCLSTFSANRSKVTIAQFLIIQIWPLLIRDLQMKSVKI